jgi:membrane fusion protein (multidrug efflux system)
MKMLRVSLLAIIAIAAAGGAWFWSHYSSLHPGTSDAYVEVNTVYISPQVSGRVAEIMVKPFQSVRKGDVLLKLDDSHYQLAVKQAQAQVALAKEQAQTARQAEKTRTAKATGEQISAPLQAAQLQLEQAQMNLAQAVITAPADGTLGQISIQPGTFVNTGERLFPVISDSSVWIAANFKETDLNRIRPGQPVRIKLDMYPEQNYRGKVDAVSPASGTAFSLIPSQNATGNWVKVTQRFPVRIRVLDRDHALPLRLGASAAVTVDTTTIAVD